jgi:two-component system, NarL family, response regulator LiaR
MTGVICRVVLETTLCKQCSPYLVITGGARSLVADRTIRTLLVEDQEITRFGLRSMLEQQAEIQVVAESADGNSAVEKALELKPDLILMDIGLPGIDGIEATKAIKSALNVKVIMITSRDNAESVFAALSAGADAYCLSGASALQLSNAIESVINGAVWLDPGIARHVIKTIQKHPPVQEQEVNSFQLSSREYDVLALVVDGLSNQEIANRLFLSCETVKTHMCHLMEKLRVSDRTQAAVKAVRQGLISENRNSAPVKKEKIH